MVVPSSIRFMYRSTQKNSGYVIFFSFDCNDIQLFVPIFDTIKIYF